MVGENISTRRDGAGALPLLIPALTPPLEPEQIRQASTACSSPVQLERRAASL
jgi:hypothetical protein